MYCTVCGMELSDAYRFCPQCGTATGKTSVWTHASRPAQPFTRPREQGKIAGVCAGIARYVGADVTLVRVLMVILALWPPGVGLLIYLICWIVMPRDPLALLPSGAPGGTETAPMHS